MPRPARPWFRFYSETLNNRKAQKLKPALFKHWINLMCLASENPRRGVLPCIEDIAFRLRLSAEQTATVLQELIGLRFLDADGSLVVMHDWEDWQFENDELADPSQAGTLGNHKRWHEDRGISSPDCSHCIAPTIAPISPRPSGGIASGIARGEEIQSDPKGSPDTEERRGEERATSRSRPLSALSDESLVLSLVEEFPNVDVRRELAKFLDYLKAKKKRYSDYVSAFKNWLRKAEEYQRERSNGIGTKQSQGVDSPFARYGT